MNTNVWPEYGGAILKETLRQEARILNRMHQPPGRLEDWQAVRKILRAKLLKAAGSFPPPPALDVREHGIIRMNGYRILNLTYQSRPDLRVTANLYVPDGPGKFPAVLNVHGHWVEGKTADRIFERCHTLAMEGFVTLSVDALGSGERGTQAGAFEYHGNQIAAGLLSIGETLLGMQVYDNMRGIDFLQSLEYVDGERIGVTGASGGGNQTMWLSALDHRVKAAVPVVSVGTFESYATNGNCWCETLPNGLTITEEWAVLAMMAPKPLLILNALKEEIPSFLIQETARSYDSARLVYRLMDAEDRISMQTINLPHGYYPEMQRHMLGWFKRWLNAEGTGWPRPLPPAAAPPGRKLLCFPKKTRPADVLSLTGYVSLRAHECKANLLKARSLDRATKIKELRKVLRIPKSTGKGRVSERVLSEADGYRMEKFTVESEPGVLIPCTIVRPRGKAKPAIVIATHPNGKAACLTEPSAKMTLADGKSLCLVDLREIGECQWAHPDDALSTAARTALWLGRTLIGNWVVDLLAVREALAAEARPSIELLGFGETSLAVLAAGVIDNRFSQIETESMLSTYVIQGSAPVMNHSIFLPGVLQWGDISLLAAMAACPIRIRSLLSPSGKPLSKRESSAWLQEMRLLKLKLRKH